MCDRLRNIYKREPAVSQATGQIDLGVALHVGGEAAHFEGSTAWN
jgi:hypothetical protein